MQNHVHLLVVTEHVGGLRGALGKMHRCYTRYQLPRKLAFVFLAEAFYFLCEGLPTHVDVRLLY